jgi:SAM-dependent methyltransferase
MDEERALRRRTRDRKESFVSYENRVRAESFGASADAYDQYRPSYPEAMIDDLCAGSRPRVLDVGCGTGKAARLFVARGCEVLGIEIDKRMAEKARGHGILVEVSPFESWRANGRTFDLVTAAQAWHWVDPDVAPQKAADVLREDGRIAVFWNHSRPHDFDLEQALQEAAARHGDDRFDGPGNDRSDGPKDWREHHDVALHAEAIEKSGRFAPCELHRYSWQWLITREHWLAMWLTWSEIAVMSEEQRSALISDVVAVLDRFADEILFDYETQCLTARKLG